MYFIWAKQGAIRRACRLESRVGRTLIRAARPVLPSTMLASPLMPTSTASFSQEDTLQYRPSRDLESFNKLLPPPIEFVEGSSSGTLAVAEGTYEPINSSPKIPSAEVSTTRPRLGLFLLPHTYSSFILFLLLF